MKLARLLPPAIAGLLLLALLVTAAAQTGRALGQPVAMETPLNPTGRVFEINPGATGQLWISDISAGELLRLDPASGQATIYAGLGSPGDARPDGQGNVWAIDAAGNWLGQLSLANETLTRWQVAGSAGFFGTQVDPASQVWATDIFEPFLYRLDPAGQQLCRFAIPSEVESQYLVVDQRGLWLTEGNGRDIFLLDPAANHYTRWQLPETGYPVGLDLDPAGDLWWADYSRGTLNRLQPALDRLAVFTPTVGDSPVMIDAVAGAVWYTDDINGHIGRLLPSQAISASHPLIRSTVPVTPSCASITPGASVPFTVTTTTLTFTETGYESLVDAAGWTILQAPEGAAPAGIRLSGDSVWAADYGRQVLVRLPVGGDYRVFLPAISH